MHHIHHKHASHMYHTQITQYVHHISQTCITHMYLIHTSHAHVSHTYITHMHHTCITTTSHTHVWHTHVWHTCITHHRHASQPHLTHIPDTHMHHTHIHMQHTHHTHMHLSHTHCRSEITFAAVEHCVEELLGGGWSQASRKPFRLVCQRSREHPLLTLLKVPFEGARLLVCSYFLLSPLTSEPFDLNSVFCNQNCHCGKGCGVYLLCCWEKALKVETKIPEHSRKRFLCNAPRKATWTCL